MAMAISSCSKHTSSFTSIPFSSYSSKLPNYSSPIVYTHPPSPNYTCITTQQDSFTVPSDVKKRESDVEKEHKWCSEATIRRKRRRRRRVTSILEQGQDDEDDKAMFVGNKPRKSRFTTPKEEAIFSWYLKERARIECVRTELTSEMGEKKLSSTEWAKAAGISQQQLDMILWKGRESEERLTACYHGLVLSISSSYQGKGLSIQDLIQEGSIGLLRGAIKFNPERGYKLSTHAYWWIRQSITRAISNKSRIIRLPGSINELMPKICEANNALSRSMLRFPTYEEIAGAIDVNPSSVRLAIERNRYPTSLDRAMTNRGCMSLQDIIPGPDQITPEAMVKKEVLKRVMRKLLEPLSDREAQILGLHYGLNGQTPRSFEEIGRLVKLSRERVRQINSAALLRLGEMCDIDDVKYFL